MANVKATFFLPKWDNDGSSLLAEIDTVENDLFDAFFGYTMAGEVSGAYLMADLSKAVDQCRSYFVILDESRLDELKDIVRKFKAGTTQEAIYFEVMYNTNIDFL